MEMPHRVFDPSLTARYGTPTLDPDQLVLYSPRWQYSRLCELPHRGSEFRPQMRSIVIAVDGGSRGNNLARHTSRAAWGVFCGPSCPHNACDLLDPDLDQTNNRAELEAVRQALLIVYARKNEGELKGWREIIIKLDSDYVNRIFCEHVWRWEEYGYKTARGSTVRHEHLIREMQDMICELEDAGNAVRFWRVGREWNQDADALVNQAFDWQVDNVDVLTVRVGYLRLVRD